MRAVSANDASSTHPVVDDDGYITTKQCHGLFICRFYNTENGECGVYQDRPLECRIYPFVLTQQEGKPAVSVHLECPYVQQTKGSAKYQEYVEFLQQYLADDERLAVLQSHPHLFGAYESSQDELETVFNLDDLTYPCSGRGEQA